MLESPWLAIMWSWRMYLIWTTLPWTMKERWVGCAQQSFLHNCGGDVCIRKSTQLWAGLCLILSRILARTSVSWSLTLSPTMGIKIWCSSLVSLVFVTQFCPTLCNPMDCSSPGSSVHGILQARILEWVAISCSRRSSIPTQGLNSCFPHCRQILYHLSH